MGMKKTLAMAWFAACLCLSGCFGPMPPEPVYYAPATHEVAVIRYNQMSVSLWGDLRIVCPNSVDGVFLNPNGGSPWSVDAGTHRIAVYLQDRGDWIGAFDFNLKAGRKYRFDANRNPEMPLSLARRLAMFATQEPHTKGTLVRCDAGDKQACTHLLKLVDETDGVDCVIAEIPVRCQENK